MFKTFGWFMKFIGQFVATAAYDFYTARVKVFFYLKLKK